MSCSKGSINRTRPQKHQNRTAFKNDLHDTSKKTKLLKSLEITGVCERCKEIIEWKIKYKKYKPLTGPKKCVACDQKTIKYAYHVLCTKCATEKHVCSKCNKPTEGLLKSSKEKDDEEIKYQLILKNLTERKRRTLLRYLKKQQEGQDASNTNIEALLAGLDNVNLDEFEDLSNDEDDASDIESET